MTAWPRPGACNQNRLGSGLSGAAIFTHPVRPDKQKLLRGVRAIASAMKRRLYARAAVAAVTGMAFAAPAFAQTPVEDTAQAVIQSEALYLQADEFIDDAENDRYIARGNVEGRIGSRILRAAEVQYYPEQERLVALGDIVIAEADGTMQFADSADLSEDLEEAVALNFSIRMANDARVTAAYLERRDGRLNLLTRATYSPCPVCEDSPTPTWRINARKALQDTEANMIYYRDVTLNIAGVPVLYSPFFAHADPSVDRKSGPLMPMVGYSSLTGVYYEQGYFWAIDPYSDLTISPRIMGEVAPLVGLNFRRNFYSGYVEFDATVTKEQRFDSTGVKMGDDIVRGSIFGGGVFRMTRDWSWGFGVERISDQQYLDRYDLYYHQNRYGLYSGNRYANLTQVFAAGQDETFYSSVTFADMQSVRLGPSNALPRLLPLSEYRRAIDLDGAGRVELVGDLAILQRRAGVDYMKATAWADWRHRHVTGGGIVLEGFGRARGDFYRIDQAFDPVTRAPKSGNASRVAGYVGADISWPFFRPGHIDLTIEPRVQLIAGAGDDYALDGFARGFSGDIPLPVLEDSLATDLNATNLFAPDKLPGLDLMEQGLRANVGVRTVANWPRILEATLFVGQSFRTDPDTFAAGSGLESHVSDLVVEGELARGPLTFTSRLRIDPDDFNIQRMELTGRLRWGLADLRATYLNVDSAVTGGAPRRYITARGNLWLTDHVAAGFSLARDIQRNLTQTGALNLTYEDDCFTVTASYVRMNYAGGFNVGPSNAFTITFTLATLGTFGTDTRALVPVY